MKRVKEIDREVKSNKKKLNILRGKIKFVKKHFRGYVTAERIKNVILFPFKIIGTYIKDRPVQSATYALFLPAALSFFANMHLTFDCDSFEIPAVESSETCMDRNGNITQDKVSIVGKGGTIDFSDRYSYYDVENQITLYGKWQPQPDGTYKRIVETYSGFQMKKDALLNVFNFENESINSLSEVFGDSIIISDEIKKIEDFAPGELETDSYLELKYYDILEDKTVTLKETVGENVKNMAFIILMFVLLTIFIYMYTHPRVLGMYDDLPDDFSKVINDSFLSDSDIRDKISERLNEYRYAIEEIRNTLIRTKDIELPVTDFTFDETPSDEKTIIWEKTKKEQSTTYFIKCVYDTDLMNQIKDLIGGVQMKTRYTETSSGDRKWYSEGNFTVYNTVDGSDIEEKIEAILNGDTNCKPKIKCLNS